MSQKPINVTSPLLPPLEEFIPYLENIWNSRVLTNGGNMHQEFENALGEYLGVDHVSLFANGTLALVTALQALQVSGEVITTPYSFVATAHSLLWNGIKPVFVDIDSKTFNIDPKKIEPAITTRTSAILAVHCYGTPCDVREIQNIADRNGLKVIYDAAHAFGVRDVGGSILRYGDLSVLSFHATKVFHTFEGGAIVSSTREAKEKIDQLKNFGFVDEVTVVEAGINGKMSEVSAACGLLNLKYVDQAINSRRKADQFYRKKLTGLEGITLLDRQDGLFSNYSYFPVLIEPGYFGGRDALYQKLRLNGINARRYFYPLISQFPMYSQFPSSKENLLPVAHDVSSKVICLPMHPYLTAEDLERVVGSIVHSKAKS